MKKSKYLTLLAPISLVLTGCDLDLFGTNQVAKNVLITEISGDTNKYVEIYNKGDKDIDLKDFRLDVHYKATKVTQFALEGTLKAGETFIYANSLCLDEVSTKADQKSDTFILNGKQAVDLVYKNNVIDRVGRVESLQNDYYAGCVLVRKTEDQFFKPSNEWDEYSWVRYLSDDYSHLKNLDVISEEDLLKGPQLEQSDFDKPLCRDGDTLVGAGGVTEVTVNKYTDGDTTRFNFLDSAFISKCAITSDYPVRYTNINTPESTSLFEAGGVPAKYFTNIALNEARKSGTKIYFQTVDGGVVKETFKRLLGWVWVGTDHLLQFDIVMAGHSKVQFEDIDSMSYKGVTYTNFLKNAELHAQAEGIGVHGNNDIYWYYSTNTPRDEYNEHKDFPDDYQVN